jgi:hypothetical protein
MQRSWPILAGSLLAALSAEPAHSFCGFYVAKADTRLFNRASQVAIVRDGDRTVMTMANDFQGDPTEFAMVIPVPTFVTREQIAVSDKALLDHLDAYSSPRLVEYHDPDPCARAEHDRLQALGDAGGPPWPKSKRNAREEGLGVTIEARYTVGEYDILILSARESGGLETWLRQNGYRIPRGASEVLGSYIRQQMRFFVARVNLEEQARLGFTYLRPLQVAYESPKFMLPIRLGTVNANGPQELFVFTLTRQGRVETTNYRTVRLPSDVDVPVYVKEEFGPFYKAMFAEQVRREEGAVVFTEYAWDMGWCDPCAANPLSTDELRRLGVWWTGDRPSAGGGTDVFLTRLHVRYDAAHFPQDLVFQQTGDRQNFQGRYVMRHPWTGEAACSAGAEYRRAVSARMEREAQTLASLTGWRIEDVRRRAGLSSGRAPQVAPDRKSWWERLWDR